MSVALATLVVVRKSLQNVVLMYPEVGVCIDRAVNEIDTAALIINGDIELTACETCGCTVEDGECECDPNGKESA